MTPPLVSRSLFWRYYGSLGRLTLLNLLWGVPAYLTFYLLGHLQAWFPHGGGAWVVLGVSLLALCVLSVGCGRVVFGVFVAEGFRWDVLFPAIRRFTTPALALFGMTFLPVFFLFNNLLIYLGGAAKGSWLAWGLSMMALALMAPLVLSWVWMAPMLYFREAGVLLTLKRSLLMVLGHPWVTCSLAVWMGLLAVFYLVAPVAGLLLGGALLLAGPCTALEKLLWGYTITFKDRAPEAVQARWDDEAAKGWRDILRPWESRRS